MVTKQQQLEWLAKEFAIWPGFRGIAVHMSNIALGVSGDGHAITREEWQQERDKMQKKSAQPAQPAQDNSWHERGEFPLAGCECEAEYDTNRKEWHKVRIIGVDDGECFFRWLSGASNGYVTGYKRNIDFRPLRTEREKAIDEMISVTLAVINQDTQRQMFGMLYDAGYRKEQSK